MIMCSDCIYNSNGKCECSGEYVSWNEYCDAGDDGNNDEN